MVGYWDVSCVKYVRGTYLGELEKEVNRYIKWGYHVDGPLMWNELDIVQRMALWEWHD